MRDFSPEGTVYVEPITAAAHQALAAMGRDLAEPCRYHAGDVLLTEGQEAGGVLWLLEGEVNLTRCDENGSEDIVGVMHAGDLVGLFSARDDAGSSLGARAATEVSALCLDRETLLRIGQKRPDLIPALWHMLLQRLAVQYQTSAALSHDKEAVVRQLGQERIRAGDVADELKRTQMRLLHTEKMSTLGQLVAGIAHELNNPVAALLGSVRTLRDQLGLVLQQKRSPKEVDIMVQLFMLGMEAKPLTSARQRERIETLAERFPKAQRSMLRAVSDLGDEGVTLCERELGTGTTTAQETLRKKIRYFELGTYLRSIQVSGQRISSLIKGLKSYARPSVDRFETIDLRDGIHDTLLILGNRLRNISVRLDLAETPPIRCIAGEMNQVWTNILSNACDALDGKGEISIASGTEGREVWVTLSDSGPGIPQEIASDIFRPGFTTKTSSGNFGLGLGLSIAIDIVQKHGGRIEVQNADPRGARFRVVLPIVDDSLLSAESR